MTWIQSHSLELLALLLYTALMVYHAWAGNRQTRSLTDYFVGGRSIGGATVGISFFATYASTNSFVGFFFRRIGLKSQDTRYKHIPNLKLQRVRFGISCLEFEICLYLVSWSSELLLP